MEERAEFGPDDRVGVLSPMDHTPGLRQFRDLAALNTYLSKEARLQWCRVCGACGKPEDVTKAHGVQHQTGAVAEARQLGAVLTSHDDTTAEQVAVSGSHGVGFAGFPPTREAQQHVGNMTW